MKVLVTVEVDFIGLYLYKELIKDSYEVLYVGNYFTNHRKKLAYFLKTSIHNAFNVLERAKRTRKRILQASISEFYGDLRQHPQVKKFSWEPTTPMEEGLRRSIVYFRHLLELEPTRNTVKISSLLMTAA